MKFEWASREHAASVTDECQADRVLSKEPQRTRRIEQREDHVNMPAKDT